MSHPTKASKLLKERGDWAFLLLCIAGAALRFYNLGVESIWWDEGFSIWVARMGFLRMLKTVAAIDFNPPLYYALLWAWIHLFGDSEAAARSISALFGVLSIAALYFLGRRMFDKKTGLLAALFLSISAFQIYYAQEARAFTLELFLAILSFRYFIDLLESRSTTSSVGYIASSSLLLYTHAFGLLIIAIQWLYLISISFFRKSSSNSELRSWVLTSWTVQQIILATLSSPWLYLLAKKIVFLKANIERASAWSIAKPSIVEPIKTIGLFAGSGYVLLLFVAISVAVAWKYCGFDPERRVNCDWLPNIPKSENLKLLLLIEWLLVPIFLTFALSLLAPSVYKPKYLIGSSPALYLLAARVIAEVKNRKVSASIALIAVALALPGIWSHYGSFHKEPWRRVAGDIEANASAGDLVLFYPGNSQKLTFDYYAKRKDLIKAPFPKKGSFVGERDVPELIALADDHRRIWVVEYHPDEKKIIKKTLEKSFRLAGEGDYPYIKVYLFEKSPSQ